MNSEAPIFLLTKAQLSIPGGTFKKKQRLPKGSAVFNGCI
jgi:hypothetical protein